MDWQSKSLSTASEEGQVALDSFLAARQPRNDLSEIVPGLLWQGAPPRDWAEIERLGIKLIVNMCAADADDIADSEGEAICDGRPTLVHCAAGRNRSGLVSALALGKIGLTGQQAIRLLRLTRCPDVLSNDIFARYVRQRFPAAIGSAMEEGR